MKKLYLLFVLIALTTATIGCVAPNETEEYDVNWQALNQQFNQDIPSQISSSFFLPRPEDPMISITWMYDGNVVDNDFFVYRQPFIDQEIVLEAVLEVGARKHTLLFNRLLVALDSPRIISSIHIDMPVRLDQITKETYVRGEVRVHTVTNDAPDLVIEHEPIDIRGRGNSTWGMPKTPLRIRFTEDVSILGMPAARNYVLLAEYADKSFVRNVLTHKLASLFPHIEHAVQTRFAELYVNGAYEGLYVLTEHVEIHENKLFIESDLSNLDAGFFLELDQRLFHGVPGRGFDWFTVAGIPYDIKVPNTSSPAYTQAHTQFISQAILQMEQALIAQSGYESHLDIDNFIEYFLVHEFMKNVDVGWSSVFFYKEMGQPFKMGPIWDFDLAIGNADYIDYGPRNFYGFAHNKNRWFHLMMNIPEVRGLFRDRVNVLAEVELPQLLELLPLMKTYLAAPAARNFSKWDIMGQYVWPNPDGVVQAVTHAQQIDYIHHFFVERIAWMVERVNRSDFV